MTRSMIVVAHVLVGMVLLAPISAVEAVESRTDKRTLGDHAFMPTELLSQPFATRSYSMIMGVGASTVDIPSASDLSLVALAMQTRVQQPIGDDYGVRLNLLGGVFSGVDSDSALTFGADGSWELGAGVFWNFMESERMSLTASIDFDGGQDYNLSPLSAITTAVDQGRVTTEGLLVKTKSFSMRPSVSAAYGVLDIVGVFGNVAYRLENDNPSVGKTDTNNFLEFGFGMSLNLLTRDIPIGVTTSYLRDQALGGDKVSTDAIEMGLYYTPSVNFAFGLTIRGDFVGFDDDIDLDTWTGILGMTYYQ